MERSVRNLLKVTCQTGHFHIKYSAPANTLHMRFETYVEKTHSERIESIWRVADSPFFLFATLGLMVNMKDE